jgi:hypothetical protein
MSRDLYQYHPVLGYHFIPGLKARVDHEAGGYLVQVNDVGFRCAHSFQKRKTSDKFRVLLFGDSYTAGDGVSNKDRYGDLLEQKLEGLEVYNFGLSGSGTDQQYLSYREFARDIECDLVVIGVLVENIRRVAARYRLYQSHTSQFLLMPKPYFVLNGDGELVLQGVPVPKEPMPLDALPPAERIHVDHGGSAYWLRKMVGMLGSRVKEMAQSLTHHQPLPEYDKPTSSEWQLLKAILRRWAGEIGVKAVIMPIPTYHYIEESSSAEGYQARFSELDLGDDVIVHDPLGDFRRFPKAERRRFRFERDPHPTAAWHRVLADSLAGVIGPLMTQNRIS